MTIKIGEVIGVSGVKVTLRIFEESNKETLFYDGDKYKGVSIREYISIQRGFRDIICIIEGEYLDEKKFKIEDDKTQYIRKVEAKPIGYFENENFREGIKFLPMIKDVAYLLEESRISDIYGRGYNQNFVIGELLKEEIPISLPWQKLFNSHIGIFGNTGSGKSNTLAKLYTVLFDQKHAAMRNKSQFVILDFNGEYTGNQLLSTGDKSVIHLNTHSKDGQDKFILSEDEFWNAEILSILFQAKANTQRPFLNRVIKGRDRYKADSESLINYIKLTFRAVFTAASPKTDTLDLLRSISKSLNTNALSELLDDITWNTKYEKFVKGANDYINRGDVRGYEEKIEPIVNELSIGEIDPLDEIILRVNLRLTNDLIHGYVQFDHIQPLLKRIESSLSSLKKVIQVGASNVNEKLLIVISLRKCNQDAKKVLPLLIAKHFYSQHKKSIDSSPPNKTMHLIIDEAHNILSQQSTGEHESWKDYRLELFEEIIKEGRKFGMFLTLASQRPADISPTIVSQIHNFFIHRLVNDRDLELINNTISTIDNLSKSLIPSLSKGACIVTGTSFDLPMIIQVHILDKEKQPDSADVDLETLWADKQKQTETEKTNPIGFDDI